VALERRRGRSGKGEGAEVIDSWQLSSVEAADAIRRRDLEPVELVESLLRRIEALEPRVKAWETLDAERALSTARGTRSDGPLAGVPFGVKDVFCTAGLRTTAYFPAFAELVPEQDAGAVARLRSAGAIVLGKTTTTQFAMVDPPPTRNPWNLERTPGGSSSGSAAAVAAGMVPFAIGTQTAGSTLRPAAYCGVTGFKPTFGRITRTGLFPVAWSLDHVGVITRTVADCRLLLTVLTGHDPADPASLRDPLDRAESLARPKLGLVRDYLDRAAPSMRAHVEGVAATLEHAGAEIQELRLPSGMDLPLAVQWITMQAEAAAVHSDLLCRERDSYAPGVREFLEVAQLIPAAAYLQAQRLRRRFRQEVDDLFGDLDALLTTTVPDVAPDPSTTGDRTPQAPWTLIGLPAITLPSGLSPDGLPLSVQLAARQGQDMQLLAVAEWCEQMIGPMPPLPL
jgi:aspartyl-tRNA(Asn)/glutamyl-tRNA(Gln) amidotransferase subunit A